LPVNGLTAGRIEDFKAWRRKEHGVREITIRHDLHALSLCLQYARKHGWLRSDPLEKVEMPSEAEAVRMHVLTTREEAVYFEMAKRYPNLYDLGRLMLNQGCRPEELLALRKDAVDPERGTFRIVSGKSKAARRTLTMTSEARGIMLGAWPGSRHGCSHPRRHSGTC
jgi:integrase